MEIIDLNAENMKQHRRLGPISGYVQFAGNLVGNTNNGFFGTSVDIDEFGTTIIVREYGTDTVRVYENTANQWTQKGQDLTGFPILLSIFDKTAAISGDGNIVVVSSTTNQVVVFQYDTSTEMWIQRGSTIQEVELDGSPIESFGVSISISADGDKVAVGAPFHDSPTANNIGFATTYFWNGVINDWERETYRDDSNNDVAGLYGELRNAFLGTAVSLSGDGNWFAVGMPGSGISDSDSARFGECRVYSSLGLITQSIVNGGAMFGSTVRDNFGYSVALNYDGNIVAVGSPEFNTLESILVGKVQVFQRSNTLWVQLGSDLIGDEQFDEFGTSIDLSDDGKTLVAGSDSGRGYARIYKFDGIDWVLQEISRAQGFDIDGIREGDELGSVAVSRDGTKVLVGAIGYDGPDTNNGLVQTWRQTDFPTFSPILNPLPQVGNLGTGGSPGQTNFVSRAFTWWQGAVAYLKDLFN
eukprot:Sro208_g087081.3  (470) ;mRNA; f:52500-54006